MAGFKGTDWKNEINVRDFIQHNIHRMKVMNLFSPKRRLPPRIVGKSDGRHPYRKCDSRAIGFDTNIATTITAHDAGYIDQPWKK